MSPSVIASSSGPMLAAVKVSTTCWSSEVAASLMIMTEVLFRAKAGRKTSTLTVESSPVDCSDGPDASTGVSGVCESLAETTWPLALAMRPAGDSTTVDRWGRRAVDEIFLSKVTDLTRLTSGSFREIPGSSSLWPRTGEQHQ